MFEWAFIKTNKINRIGYNKEVKSLYIDFTGSVTDTAYLNVPESLFQSFVKAQSPDAFYMQFISNQYQIAHIPNNIELAIV